MDQSIIELKTKDNLDIRQRPNTTYMLNEDIPHDSSDEDEIDMDKEKKLLRKLDWRIVPWIFWLYFLSVEDRSNVGYAMTMNKSEKHTLMDTAGLTGHENNIGLGLFYVAYIIFEVPSNLMMAHVNPAHWIARIMITWSIVTGCMAAISKPWHFYLLRFLLGAFEAGFWPGITYYNTLWYRPEEISSRIGVTYLAGPASGAFGGLISAGVQLIDTRGNLYGWQWLFLISAIISIIFGLATIFYLPSTPEKSTRFLNEDERTRVKKRLENSTVVRRPRSTESVEERNMKRNLKQVFGELRDFKVWLFCVLYFTPVMAATSLGYFLPKIVQEIGTFNSIQVSLMSIPPYVFGMMMVYIITRLSDYYKNRGWFIIGSSCVSFIGFCILSFTKPVAARYFGLMVVAAGTYPTVPLSMAWTANSKEDPVAVASATGIVSSIANFGALICTFALYSGWPSDAPRYIGSNMINAGAMLLAALAAFCLRIHLSKLNKQIEKNGSIGERAYPYIL
ncbi:major facilitator superfamily domain-containing protein [Cokeromyces recurvatus]|uniref:major facilitator superfamily domain-containing protein n=1 Tax=Cokeromyces recurvatus TaxID=90255 RepID=UPI002220A711|nr:major facilitator superfamily domain-containing protein [Cokeromyces recurvatus]KAI7900517.1 major facilitator superfamily domain-containing protein [Cokeromyces recurvatus]